MRIFDSELRVPKYVQLKLSIKQSIEEGKLKPHARLMSRPEMAEAYNVSHITVTKALDELESEGYLYRLHGKGTYVAERKPALKTLSVIMPQLTHPDNSEANRGPALDVMLTLLHYIEDEVYSRGWSLMLYIHRYDPDRERENLHDALERKTDAVIIFYSNEPKNNECIEELQDAGIPVVMTDLYTESFDVDYVSTDNYYGAYEATRKLIEMGFKTVHYLTGHLESVPLAKRCAGYEAAMKDCGKAPDVQFVESIGPDAKAWEESSRRVSNEVLKSGEPGAFLAAFPSLLNGIWAAIKEMHLENGSVGLGCFDEPEIEPQANVRLIKIVQPLERMARESVKAVTEHDGSHTEKLRILLKPDIEVVNVDEKDK
ncbi:MAG: substrate-binding domain-containing protein [Armatimonadota bacterium]|nr:GntR family transcriptional regulator [bacterium]